MSLHVDPFQNRRADNEPHRSLVISWFARRRPSPTCMDGVIGKCGGGAPPIRFALARALQVRASQAHFMGVGSSQTNLGQAEGLRSVPGLPNAVAYCRTRSCTQSLVRVLSDLWFIRPDEAGLRCCQSLRVVVPMSCGRSPSP